MCGRVAQVDDAETLVDVFDTPRGAEVLSDLSPSYNIAPGTDLCALRIGDLGEPSWTKFTWGILAPWKRSSNRIINARAETVTQKPMFKDAFSSRRTIIPATAYYEWRPLPTGKQPYCIRQQDGRPLLLAGLYTGNESVIITRSPQSNIAFIHDRMPLILNYAAMHQYLAEPAIAYDLLHSSDEIKLEVFPVTKKVGNPAFNTLECFAPINDR